MANWENVFISLNEKYAATGNRSPSTISSTYKGFTRAMNGMPAPSSTVSETISSATSMFSDTPSSVTISATTASSAIFASVALFRIIGTKAMRVMSGTPMISHHLILPEYRHMHREPTPAITRIATKGEAVRVRMNSRIAIPAMNISHPDRPSLYSMNMNPT